MMERAQESGERPRCPLILMLAPQGDPRKIAEFVERCAAALPGYVIDRHRWLADASPAIAATLAPQLPLQPRMHAGKIDAIREQRTRMPTIALCMGTQPSSVQDLIKDADLVVMLGHTDEPLPTDLRLISIEDIESEDAVNRVVASVQSTVGTAPWPERIDSEPTDAKISIPDLAAHIGVPRTDIPGRGPVYTWGIRDVIAAIAHLRSTLTDRRPIHIDGVCPAFLAAAIATAFANCTVKLSDPKAGVMTLVDDVQLKENPAGPLLFEPKPEEREDYTFIQIGLPRNSPDERPWFAMTQESLNSIELPDVNLSKGVVISGQLPIVLIAMIARAYQKKGAAWVAPFTPQQTRDAKMISPAMKVAGGGIEYVNVHPHYVETLPIGAIEGTILAVQRELGDPGDPAFDVLRERLRAKYEVVRAGGMGFQREHEELFRGYAALLAAAKGILTGLRATLDRHGITEREATKRLFVEAITLLTENISDAASASVIRSKLSSLHADIIAFGTIVRQVYTVSGRRIGLADIPEVAIDVIGRRAGVTGDDPALLLDHPDSAMLWTRMKAIYTQNYATHPDHLQRLLDRFPLYLEESLHPRLYLLSYNAERRHTGHPDQVIGFVRFTDITSADGDGKTCRYAGALNIDKRFQGHQLYLPLLIHTFHAEFEAGCDMLVFRAEPKLAEVYKRNLGCIETNLSFVGEHPSGDPSVLMTLTKEDFLRANSQYQSASDGN